MSPVGLIVIVAAMLAALAYAYRFSRKRDARHDADADAEPGRGLIDESATAIEDVAAQFLSIGTDHGDRRR